MFLLQTLTKTSTRLMYAFKLHRMALQLALTTLESLAEMLNERKREAEQYAAFRDKMRNISSGKFDIEIYSIRDFLPRLKRRL